MHSNALCLWLHGQAEILLHCCVFDEAADCFGKAAAALREGKCTYYAPSSAKERAKRERIYLKKKRKAEAEHEKEKLLDPTLP